MNLFELQFFVLAIMLAIAGAAFSKQWGIFAAIGGAVVGFISPFLFSQSILCIEERLYRRSIRGRQRAAAEKRFDQEHPSFKRNRELRFRPVKGKDGSIVATILHGDSSPPAACYYRFKVNSLEASPLSEEEASKIIRVLPFK